MIKFDEERQNKKLAQLRHREEEDLARTLSVKYGVKYVDLSRVAINTNALIHLSEEKSRAAEVAIFNQVSKKLSIAVRSPKKIEVGAIVQGLEKRGYTTELYMVSVASLERAWAMYKEISHAAEVKRGSVDISSDELQSTVAKLKTFEDVRALIKEVLNMDKAHRVSRFVETILAGAIAIDASDIHIEPEEKYVRLRYRLNGVLTDVVNFDIDIYNLVLSRIKLVSGLKLNVRDSAQDGRFSVGIDNVDTEIRTSILPDAYGESIVMRILNPQSIKISIDDIGMNPKLLAIVKRELKKPNGMILTTGPTGSGKTTTLYTFLSKIHTSEIKIITIEDPVEYHLPGIVQSQVDGKDYTFATGLRAALRQDPDVIMVGEIRDEEVARTAIHSALTGHLVLSTLHTNTAAGAFPRLIDLGVVPNVIGSAVNIVMAQRLVRTLCEHCKKETPLQGEQKKLVESILGTIEIKEQIPEKIDTVWEPGRCSKCNHLGYGKRVSIYEAILMDKKIEQAVERKASEREIAEIARSQGILTLRQDGILKVIRGITSIRELGRVVSLNDSIDQAELDKVFEERVAENPIHNPLSNT
ncbi:Flp pilus assembly complex ATPase component TadA [Patescibacteria group bacterium]|nr:Flp pilus assembly complex ATPase component TadA [Patescibacteria group bacterium]